MAERKLRVMPPSDVPPSHAPIFDSGEAGRPALSGEGPDSFLCGSCEAVLAKDIQPGTLVGDFIRCPDCQAINAVNP
jgi:hypothetical protein